VRDTLTAPPARTQVPIRHLTGPTALDRVLIEHLLGDSYAPFAIGKLSDALGSLQLALLILLPPLLAVAALAAATGIKHEDRDGRAMEARWASSTNPP